MFQQWRIPVKTICSHVLSGFDYFIFFRQRKEKDEMEKRHEKELSTFKKKVEGRKLRQSQQRTHQQQQQLKDAYQAQMKKERLKEQQGATQQQQQQQQPPPLRHKSSTDEEPITDHSKSNGCSPEILAANSNISKKTFSGIDKEIEQLAQFESKTKKKPPSSVVPGQVPPGKIEPKLSLNQIKVNQLQRDRVVPVEVPPVQTVTNPAGPTRNGSQVVPQATVPQQPFSGPRNASFNNLQGPQSAQAPVTSYSGAVINGPWPNGPENVQWAPNMEEHQPQPLWSAEGTAWAGAPVNSGSNSSGQYAVRIPQPFVPTANVAASQPFVVQTAPHQQMPHR